MKTKRFAGAGHKKNLKKVEIKNIMNKVKKLSSKTSLNPVKDAVLVARKEVRKVGGKNKLKVPRVLPLPKSGGALPLIPIFAALSAAGALSGGISNIVKAVNETKIATKELKESQRHNQAMEAIALGKGLYLKPYKKGMGLHLKSKN